MTAPAPDAHPTRPRAPLALRVAQYALGACFLLGGLLFLVLDSDALPVTLVLVGATAGLAVQWRILQVENAAAPRATDPS